MNQYNPNQNNVFRSVPPRTAGGTSPGGSSAEQQQFGFNGSNFSGPQGAPDAYGAAPNPFETQNPYSSSVQPAQYATQPYQGGYAPAGAAAPGMALGAPITVHEQKWADPTYTNATLGQRVGAYLLDQLVLAVVEAIILMIFSGAGAAGGDDDIAAGSFLLGLIIAVALGASYKIVLEATMGQTLGKKFLGLRLITTDGLPMGWGHSFKRNFNVLYSLIPFVGGLAAGGSYIARFFSVMNSPYNQGYHDRWGNTRLIKER